MNYLRKTIMETAFLVVLSWAALITFFLSYEVPISVEFLCWFLLGVLGHRVSLYLLTCNAYKEYCKSMDTVNIEPMGYELYKILFKLRK